MGNFTYKRGDRVWKREYLRWLVEQGGPYPVEVNGGPTYRTVGGPCAGQIVTTERPIVELLVPCERPFVYGSDPVSAPVCHTTLYRIVKLVRPPRLHTPRWRVTRCLVHEDTASLLRKLPSDRRLALETLWAARL